VYVCAQDYVVHYAGRGAKPVGRFVMSIAHHMTEGEAMSSKSEGGESGVSGNGIYIALALITFASRLWVAFTEQYARDSVPERYWGTAQFKQINRKLTVMWGCVFAAMVPFHVIAGAINTRGGNIIFNWAIPLALVLWAVKRSAAAGGPRPAGPARRMRARWCSDQRWARWATGASGSCAAWSPAAATARPTWR
jgi:hypothetical protein